MKFFFSSRALDDYDHLPPRLQKLFEKQLEFLLHNLRYPSLRAKKYDETTDRWQARVNDEYRFYFQIEKDVYVIVAIIKHPK